MGTHLITTLKTLNGQHIPSKHTHRMGNRQYEKCRVIGELTREEGICSNCKYEIKKERKRKQRTEQTRRELELIDLRTLNFREKRNYLSKILGKIL